MIDVKSAVYDTLSVLISNYIPFEEDNSMVKTLSIEIQ